MSRTNHRYPEVARAARTYPGGAPATAIAVTSAAVIEPRAARTRCPLCGGTLRLGEHTRPVRGLRRVDVTCRQCGTPRSLWFRLAATAAAEPN